MALAARESEPIEYADPLKFIDPISVEGPNLIIAHVPLWLIKPDLETAVEEDHVAELMEDFKKQQSNGVGTGQVDSIVLFHLPNFPRFEIGDGFHRTETARNLRLDYMLANIRLNGSREQLNDFRIPAARPHSRVKFARVMTWAQENWSDTSWAEEPNGLLRACTLAVERGATGAEWGYSELEAEARRAWILNKSKLWNLKPPTILKYLRSAQGADAEVIRNVREAGKGSHRPVFTQRHLEAATASLAGNAEAQRAVQKAVLETGITVDQTRQLAGAMKGATTADLAQPIVETFLQEVEQAQAESKQQSTLTELVDDVTTRFLDQEGRLSGMRGLEDGGLVKALLSSTGWVADRIRRRKIDESQALLPDDLLKLEETRLFSLDVSFINQLAGAAEIDSVARVLLSAFDMPMKGETLSSTDKDNEWMLVKHPKRPLIAKVFGMRDHDGRFIIQGFHLLYDSSRVTSSSHTNGISPEASVDLPDISFGTTITRNSDGRESQFLRFESGNGAAQVVIRTGKKMDRFPLDELGKTYSL